MEQLVLHAFMNTMAIDFWHAVKTNTTRARAQPKRNRKNIRKIKRAKEGGTDRGGNIRKIVDI